MASCSHLSTLVSQIGAEMVSVSNVFPYSRDMQEQMVCHMALAESDYAQISGSPTISLPRIDVVPSTKDALYGLMRSNKNVSIFSNPVGTQGNPCRFIRERYTFVRWDGAVSPCIATERR